MFFKSPQRKLLNIASNLKKIVALPLSLALSPRILGLSTLGISPALKANILEAAEQLRTKQLITIHAISKNPAYPDLVDIEVGFQVFGQAVRTKLTIFLPEAEPSDALMYQIDLIEREGLERVKEMGLYPGHKLSILTDTFCSGLVHCAYSPEFSSTTGQTPGYSPNQIKILDMWIRLLFANDEDRDVFAIFETPQQVKIDNKRMLEVIEEDKVSSSKKANGMKQVINEMKADLGVTTLPEFFFDTLQQYFSSTVTEAQTMFTLTQPSSAVLEVLKEDSSGSNHAIATGAAMKKLDKDTLIKNLELRNLGSYVAKAVESHNDVNSHSKETRERLKKLIGILEFLDKYYSDFAHHIENCTPLKDIENIDHQFFVNFYRKTKEKLEGKVLESISPIDLVLDLLHLIPSFNRVDLFHYQGKTLQHSYNLVAQRGNEMIIGAKEKIETFKEDVINGTVVIPHAFFGREEEFIRQANVYISINIGWGAQNVWEWVAKRYNQALPGVSGVQYVDLVRHIRTSIS